MFGFLTFKVSKCLKFCYVFVNLGFRKTDFYLKKTDFFYFVSDGKGGHRFSETYSLHRKNIKLWKDYINKE